MLNRAPKAHLFFHRARRADEFIRNAGIRLRASFEIEPSGTLQSPATRNELASANKHGFKGDASEGTMMFTLRAGKTVRKLFWASCVICILGSSPSAKATTITFNFAQVGTSFLAILPPDSPLIGQEIISARIYLDVESFPGSDAANFFTDISFPISPLLGNQNALAIFGSDLGWSGSGVFHFFEETTRLNGTFVSTRYGAETPGLGFDGVLLPSSRIEFQVPETDGLSLLALGGAALIGLRFAFRPR
jgi:hypothetical protein